MADKKDDRDAGCHFAEELATFLASKIDTVHLSPSATKLHRVSPTAMRCIRYQWDQRII